MLSKLISIPRMLDILVISFLSNIVYYNVMNISVLIFSPTPPLLTPLRLGTVPPLPSCCPSPLQSTSFNIFKEVL